MTNDALEMISCNEFSYSHGSVTLLGTSHAIFHACWVLVLFMGVSLKKGTTCLSHGVARFKDKLQICRTPT